ncbi:MAG: DUF6485 family protein [Bacillota bacterium]
MAECAEVENNKEYCTCTYEPCSRKGNCCACVKYHNEMGELPGCFFPEDVEKTYDRSVEKFVEVMG